MRFQCDRCNTRYSIADERVRGKILKIRCKSCSAVITVREGMGEEDDLLETAELARDVEVAREDVGTAEMAAASEWYVSLAGEQQGPISLSEAKAWVAEQPASSDIYCWREGFSDWLPVERTAELRGLRKPSATAPARQASRPGPASSLAQGAAQEFAERPGLRAESVTVPRGQQPSRPGSAPPLPPPPELEPSPARAATTPAPALGPSPSSMSSLPAAGRAASAPSLPGASRAATPLPVGGRPATPLPAAGRAATPQPMTSRPAGAPVLPLPARPQDEPERPAATSTTARLADNAFGTGDDGLDLDIGEPSRVVKLSMLAPPSVAPAAEKAPPSSTQALPGVGQLPVVQPSIGRSTSTLSALTGRSPGTVPSLPALVGRGTGAVPALGDSFDGESLPPEPRRRSMLPLLLGAAAVLIVAGGALAFVLMDGAGDGSDTIAGVSGARSFENLGYQVEQPQRGQGAVADTPDIANKGDSQSRGDGDDGDKGSRSSGRKPSGGSGGGERSSGDSRGSSGGSGGSGRNGDGDSGSTSGDSGAAAGTRSFSPDEIVRKSSSSQLGFQRCYERAKRKDAFLEAKNIKVSLTVTPAGNVTNLKLSSHDGDYLGECIKARIGTWKFEPSKDGIRTELSLAFEQ